MVLRMRRMACAIRRHHPTSSTCGVRPPLPTCTRCSPLRRWHIRNPRPRLALPARSVHGRSRSSSTLSGSCSLGRASRTSFLLPQIFYWEFKFAKRPMPACQELVNRLVVVAAWILRLRTFSRSSYHTTRSPFRAVRVLPHGGVPLFVHPHHPAMVSPLGRASQPFSDNSYHRTLVGATYFNETQSVALTVFGILAGFALQLLHRYNCLLVLGHPFPVRRGSGSSSVPADRRLTSTQRLSA